VLLGDKVAVIYGGGGAVGGAVARAFAREGASVHLAGRTTAALAAAADGIRASGGTVATAVVDASDEQAVEAHVASVVAASGRIDVLFNAIGMQDVQGAPLVEMPLEAFMQPVEVATRTQFLTARTVGRQMAKQGQESCSRLPPNRRPSLTSAASAPPAQRSKDCGAASPSNSDPLACAQT